MKKIRATEDLTVEVWPDWGACGDRSLVKVRSLALERDGEARPGVIVVFEDEIEHLVAALAEARRRLAMCAMVTDTPAAVPTATPQLSPPEEEQER